MITKIQRRLCMRRFARITATLSIAVLAAVLCSCNKPVETSETTTVTESLAPVTSQTETTAVTTESVTVTTETTTETTPAETSESTDDTKATSASKTTRATEEKLNTAKGKFNYVLKNKKWKFDGEMYYRKYKDGTTAYYDKEAKSYFVMDKKGQGWYYNPDIKDFVKDE